MGGVALEHEKRGVPYFVEHWPYDVSLVDLSAAQVPFFVPARVTQIDVHESLRGRQCLVAGEKKGSQEARGTADA